MKKTTIGGQAIIEGIVMKGPKKSCTVVRKTDGSLVSRELPVPPIPALWRLPILRGAYNLFTALREGMEAINYSSSFFEEEETPEAAPSAFEQWLQTHINSTALEKALVGIATVVGMVVPIVLFLILPSVLSGWLPESWGPISRNILEGGVRIALFLCFIWSISHLKDMKRTFCYHGAEHKTIFCYEAGRALTVDNVREQPRFHPRCGTSFLFVMVIIMTIVSTIVFSFVQVHNPLLRALVHLILLPLVVGISYECNRFAGRSDGLLSQVLRWPGLMLQRLTVFEPDDGMIELAIAAMQAVIPDDNSDNW